MYMQIYTGIYNSLVVMVSSANISQVYNVCICDTFKLMHNTRLPIIT